MGKSTLISRISAAKPKIADYPFTTLEPNLGVVSVGEPPNEESYVVADIPGLIEGAHLGAGLGVQFLRHIERTRVLVHLVDVSDASGRPDPVADFKVIMGELKSFGHGLDEKPMMVVASKVDVANPEKLKKLQTMAKRQKLPFYAISAVTGLGVEALKYAIGEQVHDLREREIQLREKPRKRRCLDRQSATANAGREGFLAVDCPSKSAAGGSMTLHMDPNLRANSSHPTRSEKRRVFAVVSRTVRLSHCSVQVASPSPCRFLSSRCEPPVSRS